MSNILEITLIIFMIFLCTLCLFSVLVIVRDIVREAARQSKKEDKEAEEKKPKVVEEAVPVVVVTEPVAPETEEEAPEAAPEEEERDDSEVTFNKTRMTMAEKYASISSTYREYFDAIVRHALTKEGVREFKNNNYYDYKIGAQRLVRILIKRGEVVCEFMFIDRDFKNYASANNVKMKPSATSVKVVEPSAVGVAKDGIDLVCQQIEEEKEYKKQLAREKRREQRKKLAEAEAEANAETKETEGNN